MLIAILILLLAGMLLVFLELFVPGGLLGALGVLSMAAGVYLCFQTYSIQVGVIVLIACGAVSIGILGIGFRLLPHLPVSRRFFLSEVESKEDGYNAQDAVNNHYLGLEGVAETTLRPAGIAQIGGERVDVMAESDYIAVGSRIRVSAVDSNRIMVIPC